MTGTDANAGAPIPMILTCPACSARHIDEGKHATTPHKTHACQACGMLWAPALVPTCGVQFLPGCKNDPMPKWVVFRAGDTVRPVRHFIDFASWSSSDATRRGTVLHLDLRSDLPITVRWEDGQELRYTPTALENLTLNPQLNDARPVVPEPAAISEMPVVWKVGDHVRNAAGSVRSVRGHVERVFEWSPNAWSPNAVVAVRCDEYPDRSGSFLPSELIRDSFEVGDRVQYLRDHPVFAGVRVGLVQLVDSTLGMVKVRFESIDRTEWLAIQNVVRAQCET